MIRLYAYAAATVLAASTTAWAADPLPTEAHKVLPTTLAVDAAQAAITACKAQGYSVTVTVADRAGTPIVVLVGEGARYLTREVTRRRAYTAAAMEKCRPASSRSGSRRRPASIPQCSIRSSSAGKAACRSMSATIPVGAIAAAGAPGGDKDEACALAGLAKIQRPAELARTQSFALIRLRPRATSAASVLLVIALGSRPGAGARQKAKRSRPHSDSQATRRRRDRRRGSGRGQVHRAAGRRAQSARGRGSRRRCADVRRHAGDHRHRRAVGGGRRYRAHGARANVHPSRFGQEEDPRHESAPTTRATRWRSPGRDLRGAQRAVVRHHRGTEMNVAFGGSLHPEIRELPGRMNHRMPRLPNGEIHPTWKSFSPTAATSPSRPAAMFADWAAKPSTINSLHGRASSTRARASSSRAWPRTAPSRPSASTARRALRSACNGMPEQRRSAIKMIANCSRRSARRWQTIGKPSQPPPLARRQGTAYCQSLANKLAATTGSAMAKRTTRKKALSATKTSRP